MNLLSHQKLILRKIKRVTLLQNENKKLNTQQKENIKKITIKKFYFTMTDSTSFEDTN